MLALLVVLGTAWATDHYPVSGSGKVNMSTGTGGVTLAIGRKYVRKCTVNIVLGEVVERPGGVTYYNDIVHIFSDQSGNSFTTIGDEITAPMGDMKLSRLTGYMEITEGTGWFEGACGRLSVRGEMGPVIATFELNGAMSR